jgi:SAM-dependent methyltransferase
MLSNPKENTEFRFHNNRLSLFHKAVNHVEYWKDYWSGEAIVESYHQENSDQLYEFEELFNKHIPRTTEHVILEAGCGAGLYVNAFHNRGNKVIGIDYEKEIINTLKSKYPAIDYRHGNILDLEFADNSIGFYISLGVLEHFEDAATQKKAFEEAYRVLRKGGIAFISVPYLNPRRGKHLQTVASRPSADNSFVFHQYYYSTQEFSDLVQSHGFEVIETFGYSCRGFINRELPFFKWSSSKMPWRIRNAFNSFLDNTRSNRIRKKYAHMMMFVCRK